MHQRERIGAMKQDSDRLGFRKFLPLWLGLLLAWACLTGSAPAREYSGAGGVGPRLPTPAEAEGFTRPTSNEELWAFLAALAGQDPDMKLCSLGRTGLGNSIPLLIISDPPVYLPWQARGDDRTIIYVQGGIHGNEPAGTEGILTWLSDLAAGMEPELLRHTIILVAPRVNPDGAARDSRDSAGSIDLNRDYMKLDSPEVRAIVGRTLTPWQPDLVIDLHEAVNRGYDYMLEGSQSPLVEPPIAALSSDLLLPAVQKRLEQGGYTVFPYHVFLESESPQAGITITRAGVELRRGRNYATSMQSLAMLGESVINTGGANLEKRARAHRLVIQAAMQVVLAHGDELRQVVSRARRDVVEAGRRGVGKLVVLSARATGSSQPVEFYGLEPGQASKRRLYQGIFLDRYEPVLSVSRPFAYLIDPACGEAAGQLLKHGLVVGRLSRPATLKVQTWKVTRVTSGGAPREGHVPLYLKVEPVVESRAFAAGTFVVPLDQPEADIAMQLLEPGAPDALYGYGCLDSFLGRGRKLPVYRLAGAVALPVVFDWSGQDLP